MQEVHENWTFCPSVQKTRNVNLLNEMHYPSKDYSGDEEGPDCDVQLLHVASLEMNSIKDKQSPRENDE